MWVIACWVVLDSIMSVCGYVLGVFVFLSVSVVPVRVVQYSPNPLSPPLVTLSSLFRLPPFTVQ